MPETERRLLFKETGVGRGRRRNFDEKEMWLVAVLLTIFFFFEVMLINYWCIITESLRVKIEVKSSRSRWGKLSGKENYFKDMRYSYKYL